MIVICTIQLYKLIFYVTLVYSNKQTTN